MTMTRTMIGLCLATLAVALIASPALAGDDSDIAGRIVKWEKAFNAGDTKSLAAMYTEDAARLPYQAPTFAGRAAIMEQTQATYDQGMKTVDLEVLGSESQGNMAWAHGTYALMTADGTVAQKGKWLNVSKKVKGEWRIQADIWNTDAPE